MTFPLRPLNENRAVPGEQVYSTTMEHYCYSVRTEEGTFYYDGDDLLHRTDGPAREFSNGECEWFVHGKRHREDGPAVTWPIPRPNKEQEPAVCGYEAWYVNGVRHRADGPAQVYPNGDRVWYFQGELHREDGPAVEESDRRAWYTHGVLVDAPTMVVATT